MTRIKLKLIICIIAGIGVLQCIDTDNPAMSNSGHTLPHTIEDSPHFKDAKFNDMGNALDMSFTDYVSTTWDFLFTRNHRTPDTDLPVKLVDLSHFNKRGSDQLTVTWLGHSSLMINIDGYKILTDPVFEKRISVFGPTRFNGDVPLAIQHLPKIDAVIISHDHYDHLNRCSVQRLIDKANKFIVPLAVGALLMDWGVPRDKIVELDWWQEYRLDQKMVVVATPAQHFSGRGIFDHNKTLWSSWVVKTPFHRLFYSGDSGYFEGFKQIGDRYGPFDMTFIECGAYGEGWPKVHLFPEQTVQAHLDLNGNVLHPIHWGTFNLALHPWYEPMLRLTAAAELNKVKTATPVVGDTTVYSSSIPSARWWEQAMELSTGAINTAVIEKEK
jgi:L-ascorbate metabolism protein UlaG (beta-lactamase superfamily)